MNNVVLTATFVLVLSPEKSFRFLAGSKGTFRLACMPVCVYVCVCASLAWVRDNSAIEYSIFVILAVYMYANENIEGKLGMELIGGKW